jgi:hypothetical protein
VAGVAFMFALIWAAVMALFQMVKSRIWPVKSVSAPVVQLLLPT